MTLTSTLASIPVHGGLSSPVDRIVPASEALPWTSLPSVEVNETDRTTLYRIADGTLSPLQGPMGKADYRSVIESASIERGGKRYAWTIPIVLPVTDAEAAVARSKSELALTHAGSVFGRLKVQDVFDWDKAEFVETVYRTKRTDHPGARLWLGDPRTKLVGGTIELVPFQDNRPFAKRILGPKETRALVQKRGFEQTVAFQTRNPLHRAHEYALVYGAEKLLRDTGKKTGVVLNPLVGQLKGDDVPAAERMKTYEALVEGRFLGQGDADEPLWKKHGQDLNDQLQLIGLDMRMFYGGPREAVMHSIYRQNFGFTNIIIGRKHADAPFHDGTAIWGDFDAQEIFGKLGGDLKIQPIKVGFAAYYDSIGRVDLTDNHAGEKPVSISGKDVRKALLEGREVDPRIMRPSTSRILAAAMKQ